MSLQTDVMSRDSAGDQLSGACDSWSYFQDLSGSRIRACQRLHSASRRDVTHGQLTLA